MVWNLDLAKELFSVQGVVDWGVDCAALWIRLWVLAVDPGDKAWWKTNELTLGSAVVLYVDELTRVKFATLEPEAVKLYSFLSGNLAAVEA